MQLNVGRINKTALLSNLKEQSTSSKWLRWPYSRPVEAKVDVRKTLFLVCGPEPYVFSTNLSARYFDFRLYRMVAAISGPYGRNFSQGPVGGVLARLGATSSQVYKL